MFDAMCEQFSHYYDEIPTAHLITEADAQRLILEQFAQLNQTLDTSRSSVQQYYHSNDHLRRTGGYICQLSSEVREAVFQSVALDTALDILQNPSLSLTTVHLLALSGNTGAERWADIIAAIDDRVELESNLRWEFCAEDRDCFIRGLSFRTGIHWYDAVCSTLISIGPDFKESRQLPDGISCVPWEQDGTGIGYSSRYNHENLMSFHLAADELPDWVVNPREVTVRIQRR